MKTQESGVRVGLSMQKGCGAIMGIPVQVCGSHAWKTVLHAGGHPERKSACQESPDSLRDFISEKKWRMSLPFPSVIITSSVAWEETW